MEKYRLAKTLANTICVSLGVIIFFLTIALIVPCGAGPGKCGPTISPVLLIILGVVVMVWVQSSVSSLKTAIDEHGEQVAREHKLIIPVLYTVLTIIVLPIIALFSLS